jgi:hypothetical protein
MKWSDHSIYTIKSLFRDESYAEWSRAVHDDETLGFSEELDELLSRLAGVVVSEFSVDPRDKDKLVRLMELAALAGRNL